MFDQMTIGLGIVHSLMIWEILGLSAGGIIVPGYLALNIHRPINILMTYIIALITFYLVNCLKKFMVIFGKRRTTLLLIIGMILGLLVEMIPGMSGTEKIDVVGFLIPGLLALSFDKQGIIATLSLSMFSFISIKIILIFFI